jgi:DNA-binding MarR family transcriptional regulator
MPKTIKTALLSELVLEVFRLNGRLIAAGDSLVAPLGLTSARWQVLGAIVIMREPSPVVRWATAIGLTRQSVQRIVDELETEGVITFRPNPRHKRAKLVTLTAKGSATIEATMKLQQPWAATLAAEVDRQALETTLHTLKQLRAKTESAAQAGGEF